MIYQTDETRDRIMATATGLFVRQGLFATQMQDIAIAVGISRTSLYRYFRDKFDLATAIVNSMFAAINERWIEDEPALIAGRDGLACVDCYLREYWLATRFATELFYLAEYDAFFSGVRVTPELGDRIKVAFLHQNRNPLIEYLQRGMADGSIRAELDAHLTAVTLVNAVRGLQQRLLLRGRVLVEVEAAELPRMTDELVHYLINGIRTPRI